MPALSRTDLSAVPVADACVRTHEVLLEFEDGVSHSVQVTEGEAVLMAALAQGVPLVHQCRSGSCGTCSALVAQGTTVMDAARANSLLPSEVEAGHRLTCSTSVTTAARFLLPYSSELAFGPAPRITSSTVTEVAWLSDSVVRLGLELDDDDIDFGFRSGQYARIRVPGTEQWRSYSMFTTPLELPRIGFLVKVLRAGVMSDYVRCAAVGDSLMLEGPLGSFSLRHSGRPHVLVAGGTGLAPILSMLDTIRTAPGRTPPVELCFACTSERDLFFEEELDLRAAWMPTLRVRVGVSRPQAGYSGCIGDPVTLLDGCDLATTDVDAYLCGPPGMVESARRRLCASGVPETQIHSERFVASDSG